MPLYADRAQETTTTTGTGTITLGGAVSGYRTFSSAVDVGDRVNYCIFLGTEWEVGTGILLTSSTMSREEVFSSSNSNALVSFSAGSKTVFINLPAQCIADIGLSVAIHSLWIRC